VRMREVEALARLDPRLEVRGELDRAHPSLPAAPPVPVGGDPLRALWRRLREGLDGLRRCAGHGLDGEALGP
jgi:hypothetical protein